MSTFIPVFIGVGIAVLGFISQLLLLTGLLYCLVKLAEVIQNQFDEKEND